MNYFSQFITLGEEEVEIIKNEDIIRENDKNDALLKGCVKRYYLEDGEEKIMEFYTENDPSPPLAILTKNLLNTIYPVLSHV